MKLRNKYEVFSFSVLLHGFRDIFEGMFNV